MAQPTIHHVDPFLDSNTGDGSVGSPYGDLQYALNTETRDATNGDEFQLEPGALEFLTAALSLTMYGPPTEAAPLVISGTAAFGGSEDNGIDGSGSYGIIAGNPDYVHFKDMQLTNCGSATILDLNQGCSVVFCEIANTSGDGIDVGEYCLVARNHIHNIGGDGVQMAGGSNCYYNYFKNDGTNDFASAINLNSDGQMANRNIISVDGASNGILLAFDNCAVMNNSILSVAGLGIGIDRTGSRVCQVCLNNVISGFSETGGIGIDYNTSTRPAFSLIGHNYVHNCATAYEGTLERLVDLGDNESGANDPFLKSGSDSFSNRGTYFCVNDVGNVKAGAYPRGTKGAVEFLYV